MLIDSPFEHCPRCGECVLLDQTPAECAAEHGCQGGECPLKEYFEGRDFVSEAAAPDGAEDPLEEPSLG